MIEKLRFPARTAAFAGITFGMYGLLELDTARSPESDREAVLRKWIQRYGKALLGIYGVDVAARGPHIGAGERYPGRDARGLGRVFVMNHRSALDIPVTLAFFEATIVSRSDLAGWPVIGIAARRVGTLFVDRSSKQSGAAVINAMVGALERGIGVMVYPEGTTFAGDLVRPLRAGAFLAAQRVGAEIVPAGIAYEGKDTSFVDEPFAAHMMRVSSSRGARAALQVGDPIQTEGKRVEALQEEAQGAMQSLVDRARIALGGGADH